MAQCRLPMRPAQARPRVALPGNPKSETRVTSHILGMVGGGRLAMMACHDTLFDETVKELL